ncbi:glycosyltransferase family 2 protein [Lactobacillus acidophilus]
MTAPLISVIIPVYNREDKIKRAILSVLQQDYKNLEILVIDDGSTDNTSSVVKSMKDPRIKYRYQENQGACAARNKGISLAKGDFIAFHDSDDIWHSNKLQRQLPILFDKKADIVFCKLNIKNKDGHNEKYPSYYKEGIINPVNTLLGIGTQTLIMRADIAKKNLFDDEMPRFQELEFLMRAVIHQRLYCVDEPLVDYILGNDNISRSNTKLIEALKIIIKKHPDVSIQYPYMAKQFVNMLAGIAEYGDNKEAIDLLRLAQRYNFTIKTQIKLVLAQLNLFKGIVLIKNKLKKRE